jgi:hypothetical protein
MRKPFIELPLDAILLNFKNSHKIMLVNNKLDKSFGPVGSASGILIFAVGLVMAYQSLLALLVALLGAFFGFSYSSTHIDFDQKRVRFSNNLFGIFKTGKWINIEPNMAVGLKKNNRTWRSYSKGNRTYDCTQIDFRLNLYDSNNKIILPLKKVQSVVLAKEELELMANLLGLKPI